MIWGVSCGVPDKEEEASSCVTVTTDTSDGYLCTCNSSYCNAIDRCASVPLIIMNVYCKNDLFVSVARR